MPELHFFDRTLDYSVVERRLPHWVQPGALCFITFRTADSMPNDVLKRWREDRDDWLRRQQINPRAANWRQLLSELNADLQESFYRTFSTKWHEELDAGHGACVFRDPGLARTVADSLQHADGTHYELTDFVVMPNHVHLLAAFQSERGLLDQCESWKRWTATHINRQLARSGRFWQQDGFDHLVRSEEQFQHFRKYISENPRRAGLNAGEFLLWTKEL